MAWVSLQTTDQSNNGRSLFFLLSTRYIHANIHCKHDHISSNNQPTANKHVYLQSKNVDLQRCVVVGFWYSCYYCRGGFYYMLVLDKLSYEEELLQGSWLLSTTSGYRWTELMAPTGFGTKSRWLQIQINFKLMLANTIIS